MAHENTTGQQPCQDWEEAGRKLPPSVTSTNSTNMAASNLPHRSAHALHFLVLQFTCPPDSERGSSHPQPGSPGGHQDLQSISTNRPLGLGIQVQRVWVEQADLTPHPVVVSLKTDALSSPLPPGSPAAAHHSPRNGPSIYQHPHTETHLQ